MRGVSHRVRQRSVRREESNHPMRIVYIVRQIDSTGGRERVLINKANYFVEHFGYEVFIITMHQQRESPAFALDPRVKVVHLDLLPRGRVSGGPLGYYRYARGAFRRVLLEVRRRSASRCGGESSSGSCRLSGTGAKAPRISLLELLTLSARRGGAAVPCPQMPSRGHAMVRESTDFALWPLCRPDRGRQSRLGPSRHCCHSELSVVRDGDTRGMRQSDRPVHGTHDPAKGSRSPDSHLGFR